MAKSNGKIPEPEVLPDGIKVYLADDQWFLFKPDGWVLEDEFLFQKANDFDAFRMIVEKLQDWHLQDINGAWVPFNQAELLAKLEAIGSGLRASLPRIPVQMQVPMANAFYYCLREVRRLPLPLELKSTS